MSDGDSAKDSSPARHRTLKSLASTLRRRRLGARIRRPGSSFSSPASRRRFRPPAAAAAGRGGRRVTNQSPSHVSRVSDRAAAIDATRSAPCASRRHLRCVSILTGLIIDLISHQPTMHLTQVAVASSHSGASDTPLLHCSGFALLFYAFTDLS